MQTVRTRTFAIAIGALVTLLGCGDSVEPRPNAELRVAWELGPQGCQETDIETVRARLQFDSGTRTEQFNCQTGEGSISDLRPANYRVRLQGIDSEGTATYGAESEEVTVRGGDSVEMPPLRLTALPAEVHLTWRFGNGRVCGANRVERVQAALFDEDDFRVAKTRHDCTDGRLTFDDVPPGEYLAELRAPGTNREFAGAVQLRAPRGRTVTADVVLEQVDPGDSGGEE